MRKIFVAMIGFSAILSTPCLAQSNERMPAPVITTWGACWDEVDLSSTGFNPDTEWQYTNGGDGPHHHTEQRTLRLETDGSVSTLLQRRTLFGPMKKEERNYVIACEQQLTPATFKKTEEVPSE